MPAESLIGDVVTLRRGTTYKGALVGKPGPALLGLGSIVPGGGFRDDYKTYGGECPPELLLVPGDLYVSLKGATKDGSMIGSVARVPNQLPSGRLTQDTVRLVFRERDYAFERYLYWLLRTPDYRDYCAERATGSAVAALSRDDFLAYPVPQLTPSRSRIVDVLESIEDKIELNRRSMAGALALARAHVDRTTEGKPSTPYRSALEVRMGSAFKGSLFTEPGIGRPLLRIRDLKTFESQIWTTEVRKDETTIKPGDIVVGMDAEFRATLWLGTGSVLNQRVCSFRGQPGVGRAFVLASLEPELAFQEQAKTGTTVIHLNKADIDTFTVPALSVRDHHDLILATEPLIDMAVARSIENRALVSLRDTLLQAVLSDRIDIREADETVEAYA